MKKRIIVLIILLSILPTTLIICFCENHTDAFDIYADVGIKGGLTKEINLLISERINSMCANEEYIKIQSDDETISYISVDTAKINILANLLSDKIYSCIDNRSNDFAVPLGNTLGIRLLSGKGPKIGFTVAHLGSVAYEINSELISSGINQTLHRISIDFKTEISCIAPFYEAKNTINNTIVISEILIVGKVPEVMFSTVGK